MTDISSRKLVAISALPMVGYIIAFHSLCLLPAVFLRAISSYGTLLTNSSTALKSSFLAAISYNISLGSSWISCIRVSWASYRARNLNGTSVSSHDQSARVLFFGHRVIFGIQTSIFFSLFLTFVIAKSSSVLAAHLFSWLLRTIVMAPLFLDAPHFIYWNIDWNSVCSESTYLA